jgi:RHS repeat-associated protein
VVGDGSADDVHWTLGDHQNSIRDMIAWDAANSRWDVADHITYDAYGTVAARTGAIDCLFASTGRLFDEATDLRNDHQRWYPTRIGRWLNEDPIRVKGRDANFSRYCGNNPTNAVDPTGTVSWNPFTWWVDWSEQIKQEEAYVEEFNRLLGTHHRNLASFTAAERARIEATLGEKFDWDAASAIAQSDRPWHERLETLDNSETSLRVAEVANDAAGLIAGGQGAVKAVRAARAARAATAGETALAVAEEALVTTTVRVGNNAATVSVSKGVATVVTDYVPVQE